MVSADLFSTTRLGTQLPNTKASSPRLTSMPLAARAGIAASVKVASVMPRDLMIASSGRDRTRLQALLAPRRQHLQDRRRRLLDRATGDIDRHPLAPGVEAARFLDL